MNTREKILAAAFRLFLSKGYKEMSLEQLVSELQLSKGAFYHYFDSKQSLFKEVIDNYFISAMAILNSAEYDPSKNFVDNIMRLITSFLEDFIRLIKIAGDDINELNFYGLMLDSAKYYPGFLKEVSEEHKTKELLLYEQMIIHAKQNNDIRTIIDTKLLAKHLQIMLDGFGFNKFFEGSITDYLPEVRLQLQFLYELIRQHKP